MDCASEKLTLTLPKDKIMASSRLKAFADDKIHVVKMMISHLDKVENTVGKGENTGYQHFLHFPAFSKAFYFKVGIVL